MTDVWRWQAARNPPRWDCVRIKLTFSFSRARVSWTMPKLRSRNVPDLPPVEWRCKVTGCPCPRVFLRQYCRAHCCANGLCRRRTTYDRAAKRFHKRCPACRVKRSNGLCDVPDCACSAVGSSHAPWRVHFYHCSAHSIMDDDDDPYRDDPDGVCSSGWCGRPRTYGRWGRSRHCSLHATDVNKAR